MSALCRPEAIRRIVVEDIDVQAEQGKGAIIQRMALEWAYVGWATAVNTPRPEADPGQYSAHCIPDNVENFSLVHISHFSRAEVPVHYPRLRAHPENRADGGLNRSMGFRSYSYVVPSGRFARSIPIFP
jgi:hypothetical protein